MQRDDERVSVSSRKAESTLAAIAAIAAIAAAAAVVTDFVVVSTFSARHDPQTKPHATPRPMSAEVKRCGPPVFGFLQPEETLLVAARFMRASSTMFGLLGGPTFNKTCKVQGHTKPPYFEGIKVHATSVMIFALGFFTSFTFLIEATF